MSNIVELFQKTDQPSNDDHPVKLTVKVRSELMLQSINSIGFSQEDSKRLLSQFGYEFLVEFSNRCAQWGADQELQAIDEMSNHFDDDRFSQILQARRSNKQSLLKRALKIVHPLGTRLLNRNQMATIRAALLSALETQDIN